MFSIRYENDAGNRVTAMLAIAPSDVDYPETRAFKALTSQDGRIVIQRPLMDERPRKWIWRGYGPSHSAFATQWSLLETLEQRRRLEARLPPIIEIYENVSGVGGFNRTASSSPL